MKIFKIIIDLLMPTLFILLIGYHLIPEANHEYIGISLFIIFIIHNLLNYKWYKNLFKGRYTVMRITSLLINVLLMTSMIIVIFSSIMISNYVFLFYSPEDLQLARKLHLCFTMWSFIFMSVHLGLHFGIFVAKFKNKIRINSLELLISIVSKVIAICIVIFGIIEMSIRNIHEEMFLKTEFKFYNYESITSYAFKSLTISLSIMLITYYLKKLFLYIKRKQYVKNKPDLI